MGILTSLFSFLGRSAGTIVNALFGWAVMAIFGNRSKTESTLLSVLVGAAATWPIVLLGVAFPKIAAFALALALLIPAVLGLTIAARSKTAPSRAFWRRVLSGVPITLGLSAAFLVMFVVTPVLKLRAAARRRKEEHMPLITDADAYQSVAKMPVENLGKHHIHLEAVEPPWWMKAPSAILKVMGGHAFQDFLPERLAYYQSPSAELALYPNDLLIRGDPKWVARIHLLSAIATSKSQALQTFDAIAQKIEGKIERLWIALEARPHFQGESTALQIRGEEITHDLLNALVSFEDSHMLCRNAKSRSTWRPSETIG